MRTLLLIIAVACIIVGFAITVVPDAVALPSAQEQLWNVKGKEAIRKTLKDPDSAIFQNVFFNMAIMQGRKIPTSCGSVNAKNGYGGRDGFYRYVYLGPGKLAMEHMVYDFHNIWNKLCIK